MADMRSNGSDSSPPGRQKWIAGALALVILLIGAFVVIDAVGGSSDEADIPAIGSEGVETTTAPERPAADPPQELVEIGEGIKLSRFTVSSEAVGENLPVSVLEPAPAPRVKRTLLVFLHGAGGSDETSVTDPALLATLERLGRRAPIVAFPDGRLSWWRERPDGDWGRYVVHEVIPAVTRRYDVDPRRVAIGGISMGGYGAYHIGLRFPQRFCAVGGHSAGIYLRYEGSSFGAFDNAADFRRNDIVTDVRRDPDAFGEARIWNDYGDEDWFVEGNAAFVEALEQGDADLTAHVWPGGHDGVYWSEHWPDYLRFYSRTLADC